VLFAALLLSTELAAVVLVPGSQCDDPEDLATAAGTANSLTEEQLVWAAILAQGGGLDNGRPIMAA